MSKQQEALQFLDSLDSLNVSVASKPSESATTQAPPSTNEAEALAFLDEITQKSSEPTKTTTVPTMQPRTGTPRTASRISLRKGADGVTISRSSSPAPSVPGQSRVAAAVPEKMTPSSSPSADQTGASSWGWGSVWSTASAAVKQAKTVVDEQVKYLPKNDQAKKWSEGMMEYVKNTQLDKLGQDLKSVGLSTFNDILNVVAPPIAEHEVIQVILSHDLKGYDGVETLVYQALARVMEQVEGGDLVVNKGEESKPKESLNDQAGRELGGVEGFDAALKLAKANIDDLIKNNPEKAPAQSTASNPTTYSQVYLRLQPYYTSLTSISAGSSTATDSSTHLQFLLYLTSPSHSIAHYTTTQVVPRRWIDAFQEEDAAGKGGIVNAWVEDVLVEVLRVGLEVLGQEYIAERMGWGKAPEVGEGEKKAAEVATS